MFGCLLFRCSRYIPLLSTIVSLFGAGAAPFFYGSGSGSAQTVSAAPAPAPAPTKMCRLRRLRLRLRLRIPASNTLTGSVVETRHDSMSTLHDSKMEKTHRAFSFELVAQGTGFITEKPSRANGIEPATSDMQFDRPSASRHLRHGRGPTGEQYYSVLLCSPASSTNAWSWSM